MIMMMEYITLAGFVLAVLGTGVAFIPKRNCEK